MTKLSRLLICHHLLIIFCLNTNISKLFAQPFADFTLQDTVCAGIPVTLQNLTTGGSTFYWNFCSGNSSDIPTGKNIGNPGNLLSVPTYSTLVTDNNECFSFISDQGSQSVIRYDHGISFANQPSNTVNLGTFGVLTDAVEGIQIKKEGSVWIGFVCNYDQLVRLNFGTSLKNIPVATVIGPVPELEMAHGFLLIHENGEWIGLIACTIGNRFVRLHFGNSLLNTPTFENLGTPGNLNSPGPIVHIIEGGNNYVFIVNLNSSKLSRLDFGNSVNNIPVGVNLGNVCGTTAMGITMLRDCGTVHGFITRYLNSSASNDLLWKISFPDGITGSVQTENLGNIGSLERPSLFSELFRQNDTLFVYASNRGNGTRTLYSFPSCNQATPPSSYQFNPPVFTYNQPGVYNIRLIVNEGLPDQVSICKSIVVVAGPCNITADFEIPDTVCVNTPVHINNLTTGGTSYYWSFCSGNTLSDPIGTNIGNPGGLLNIPGYSTLMKDGPTCYSFINNQGSKSVVRYNHGTSFNNNPVSWTNLGDFGMLSDTILGIKICYDNGKWIGFVNNNNRIVRLNFGASLSNIPSATLLGPFPMLNVAHCLDIFHENSTWIGFLTCSTGNKIVRLNFGNSLLNAPVLTDLGAPGSLNLPGSFRFINENGSWFGLVANMGNNTLTRLSFGNSLMNNPSGENLGVVCPSMNPGGLSLIRDCGEISGFQLNYSSISADLIWRLSFPSGITGPITGQSLGNIGGMSRPAHFSELFRVGDTLFLYNTNRQDFTLTRLRFLPCSNASIPSSIQFNPPPFSYNQPGTYNIRMIVNEGLPNQSGICKNITVINKPQEKSVDTTLCYGDSLFAEGQWQHLPGTFHDSIPVADACDSLITTILDFTPRIPVDLGNDTTLCNGNPLLLHTGVTGAVYQWQDGSADSNYLVIKPGHYWVIVTRHNCNARDSIAIDECSSPIWFPNAFTPNNDGINDVYQPIGMGVYKFTMNIFNRWGGQVFETADFGIGWDGRFGGADASDGVYYYIATFEMADSPSETNHAHGSVTLLR